jgi:hypothetical protein
MYIGNLLCVHPSAEQYVRAGTTRIVSEYMLLVKKQRYRKRNIIIVVMNSRVASDTFPAEGLLSTEEQKKKKQYSNGR